MSSLTRDTTAEPVSRDQIFRRIWGQGDTHFPCSADHEQDWQPYAVDPYSAIYDGHTLFGVLGPQCWTGPSMLDCHVRKGFGIYMIGILGSLC